MGKNEEQISAAPVSARGLSLPNLKTPAQIVESCPFLTMGALRKMLLYSDQNRLEACLIRAQRRIGIDEVAFLAWLEEHRGGRSGSLGEG